MRIPKVTSKADLYTSCVCSEHADNFVAKNKGEITSHIMAGVRREPKYKNLVQLPTATYVYDILLGASKHTGFSFKGYTYIIKK